MNHLYSELEHSPLQDEEDLHCIKEEHFQNLLR